MKHAFKSAILTLLTALMGTSASTTHAAPRYVVTTIGPLPGYQVSSEPALNDVGQVVATSTVIPNLWNSTTRAILYSDGTLTNIGKVVGGTANTAIGININGQIVGNVTLNYFTRRSFLYQNGTFTLLPLPNGSLESSASGINASGQVIGTESDTAWLYSNGTSTAIGAPLNQMPGSTLSQGVALNDFGQAIVHAQQYLYTNDYSPFEFDQAYLYQNGVLSPLVGSVPDHLIYPNAINNAGQIIGQQQVPFAPYRSILYNASTNAITDLGTIYPRGLNDSTQIVGSVPYAPTTHAARYDQGVTSDLNTEIAPNSDWILTDATAINARGQIVGNGQFHGRSRAFLLTPLVTIADPPSVPQHCSATTFSSSEIDLSWTPVVGADSYQVYRSSTLNGPFALLGDSNGTTNYEDTGLPQLTTYYYTVVASNSHGSSAQSAVVSATTLIAIPDPVTNLAATVISPFQIDLTWTAAARASGYDVYRHQNNTGDVLVAHVTGTQFSNTGLSQSTKYTFVIYAINTTGAAPAATITATTNTAPPTPVTNFHWVTYSKNDVQLGWTASLYTTAYQIFRSNTLGTTGPLIGQTTTPAFDDIPTVAETTYYYTIMPVNGSLNGPKSAQIQVTTAIPLNPPYYLSATALSATRIDLSWDASENATSYQIFRSSPGGTSGLLVETTSTHYSDQHLSTGSPVTYVILSKNSTRHSQPSEPVTVSVVPQALTALTATAAGRTQINLAWSAAPLATNYKIFRSEAARTFHRYIGQTTSLRFADTNLSAGKTYFYIVVPNSVRGDGPKSGEVNASTSDLPEAPTNLKAISVSKSQIKLSWTAAAGATGYWIYRSPTPGGFHSYVGSATSTNFTNYDLTASTSYYYIVVGINSHGIGPKSSELATKTLAP